MATEKEYTTVPVEDGKEEAAVDQSPMKCVDDFLKMSNYCYLILLISEFFLLVGAGNMIFMVFAGSAPRVSCHGSNFTVKDVCKSHLDPNKLTDCDLEVNYEFKSLNVEFGYLCAEGRWVKSSISVQMVGVLIGTLFFGTMSDRYGRKSSLLISYVMTSVFSIAASFSNSLVAFTVLRTILGFFSGGLLGTYGVYKMEHIPKRHRFWVATVIAWAPNFIMLNVVAYFSHDWRTFQRVLVIISSPAILLFFFVHESPRWLIQKGKIKEARHVLQRIQHIDRQKESKKEEMEKMLDIAHQELQLREKKMKNYNVRHLFYNKEMTLATLVFCGGVFMSSMINYGLIFNIETLSGSFFVNSILMGFIRWSINIAFGVLDFNLPSFNSCSSRSNRYHLSFGSRGDVYVSHQGCDDLRCGNYLTNFYYKNDLGHRILSYCGSKFWAGIQINMQSSWYYSCTTTFHCELMGFAPVHRTHCHGRSRYSVLSVGDTGNKRKTVTRKSPT
ncbi:hypothetical protein V3C99_007408 [Haemonchus contortus]